MDDEQEGIHVSLDPSDEWLQSSAGLFDQMDDDERGDRARAAQIRFLAAYILNHTDRDVSSQEARSLAEDVLDELTTEELRSARERVLERRLNSETDQMFSEEFAAEAWSVYTTEG